jgi:hypothetical protein
MNGDSWTRLDPFGFGWMTFAPDGRSIAFQGNDGLYVSRVPATGAALQVSPKGADEPEWSPRGDALYYRVGMRWMTVAVSSRGTFMDGKPRVLFSGRYLQVKHKSYDVGPDGRFLLLAGPNEETTTRLEVVTGFFGELRRRAGVARR